MLIYSFFFFYFFACKLSVLSVLSRSKYFEGDKLSVLKDKDLLLRNESNVSKLVKARIT